MKYVNQPDMNAVQKIKLKRTQKYSIIDKTDLILNKDMEHNEIMREKENLKIGNPHYEREF